ncbi:MAG: NDP-sugar synthase [Fervidicoccaceae archaeon]
MVSVVYVSHTSFENLYPLTKRDRSVSNISILGKPVAVWMTQSVLDSGFTDFIVAYPYISQEVRAAVGERTTLIECEEGSEILCAQQAISRAKENDIAFIAGSHMFSSDFLQSALAAWNEAGGKSLAVLVPSQIPHEELAGKIGVEVEFIGKYVKRAALMGDIGSPYLFTGVMFAERDSIVSRLQNSRNLNEVLLKMLNEENPSFYIYSGKYSPISSPWQLLEIVKSLLTETVGMHISSSAKVSPTAILEGPVIIEDDAVIDHYSIIKGPAYISRGAFVGAHTLLRAGVSVEPYAIIGSGAEVKRSYIGMRATIGSHSNVTDSVIGERATLRPLVVTLNFDVHEARKKGEAYRKRGAIVGEGAIVNGGTALRPGSIIEPGQIYP